MHKSRIGRIGLAGGLVGILGAGPPLVGGPPVHAATIHAPRLAPILTLPRFGTHGRDDGDGQDCGSWIMQCMPVQTCQPVVIVKRVAVPVIIVKKVFVPVTVVKVVKVFVPVSEVPPTATPATTGETKVTVKVTVPGQAPPPAPTPIMVDPPPPDPIGGPPMF